MHKKCSLSNVKKVMWVSDDRDVLTPSLNFNFTFHMPPSPPQRNGIYTCIYHFNAHMEDIWR